MAHSLVCFGFDITFHSNLFSLQCSGTFVIVWLICSCKFVSTLCVLFGDRSLTSDCDVCVHHSHFV